MADPITPPTLVYDPERPFQIWRMDEIYVPNKGGQYVPNKNDAVWDWDQGLFRVVDVNIQTGVSTLVKWVAPRNSNQMTDLDILLGAGPGTVAESYRAYLDTSVMPHTLACDKRLHLYGSTATSIKIFLGTDIGVNGEVISQFYDQSNNFLGENIPLELVATPEHTNHAIKTPKVGYTTRNLPDGEVVTAVVYDDVGGVASICPLVIKNTKFIRSTDASMKYIRSISVETPFLSASDPKTIEYPINMPVEALNLIGVVTYSDGTQARLPVDGTKFAMHGLDNYIASVQGQKLDIVLTYLLSEGEYSYATELGPNNHISERYKATTTKADGAYSIRLFSYPVWIDPLSGYRLSHWLYNLDRQEVYDVTNLVQMASGSRAFDPIAFGVVQKIALAIDLNRVDPSFNNYRHVQSMEVALLANGNNHTQDNWTVAFTPGQNPHYGVGLQSKVHFVNSNNWEFDISCGCTTQAEWLEKVFYASQPLFDPETEAKAPEPNFFTVVAGMHRLELPIEQWNSTIVMHEAPGEGQLTLLEFIRRRPGNDLQLGISGLVTHHS